MGCWLAAVSQSVQLPLVEFHAESGSSVLLRIHTANVPEQTKLRMALSMCRSADTWASRVGWTDVVVSHSDDLRALTTAGLQFTTQVNNVDALIQETSGTNTKLKSADFSENFHTSEEIHNRLEALAKAHAKRAKIVILSKSVNGASIKGIRVGASSKPEIVILGGQHAREWIGPAALMHVVENMLQAAELGETDTVSILDNFQVTIAPLMNPDGYSYSHRTGDRMWRKNLDGEEEWRKSTALGNLGEGASARAKCFGVDLNRNWMVGKKFAPLKHPDGTENGCDNTFEGKAPFSEPETQGVRDYMQGRKLHRARGQEAEQGESSEQDGVVSLGESSEGEATQGVIAFMDVHSYGEDIIFPGCDQREMTPEAAKKHKEVAAQMTKGMNAAHGQGYTAGTCQEKLGYQATGVAGDWAHFDAKIPYSFSVEARSAHSKHNGGYGFVAPASDIKPTGDELLGGIKAMAKAIQAQEERA